MVGNRQALSGVLRVSRGRKARIVQGPVLLKFIAHLCRKRSVKLSLVTSFSDKKKVKKCNILGHAYLPVCLFSLD